MATRSSLSTDEVRYRMRYVSGVLLCVAGSALALRFPDLDHQFSLPPLMMHRSLLMHGFLPSLLLYCWMHSAARDRPEGPTYTHPSANPIPRLFCLGVCTGYATHLAFDLFPRAWSGYALVYAPGLGHLPAFASIVWLALSTLGCLYLACRLLRYALEVLLGVSCLAACFGVASVADSHAAIGALFALTVAAGLAFALTQSARRT